MTDTFIDLETETAILGASLADPDTARTYQQDEHLTAQHFATEQHQTLWQFIGHYLEHGQGPLSSIAIRSTLDTHPDLIVGRHLPQEIAALSQQCVASEHANDGANPEHAKTLRDLAERRRLANLARQAFQELANRAENPEDIASRLTAAATEGRLNTDPNLDRTITDGILVSDAIEQAIPEWETDDRRRYHPTGIHELDQIIGGLEPGRLYVIAARPAMGKSILTLMLARHYAATKGHVQHWSLEMAHRELAERYVAMTGATSLPALTKHDLRAWKHIDWGRILEIPGQTASKRLLILQDRPGLHVDQIIRHARRQHYHHNKPLSLLSIDYAGLLGTHDPRVTEPRHVLSHASRRLKQLSIELDIPVILVSQLNRKVDERTSKRPMLSDLRESGSLEQDADQVIFVFRPSAYNDADRPGEADLIVAKNRAGRTGDATVRFDGAYARFTALGSTVPPPPTPSGINADLPLPNASQ